MRKFTIFIAAALFSGLLATAPAFAAEVIQGKCLENNVEARTITIEEYDINFDKDYKFGHPTGINTTVDVSTAKVGIDPVPGDILRIAYEAGSGKKVALKVMNITKQNLMKK
ncbi:hypothetical protein [Nitratidesulfovibrio sp. 1201_IL3209]|uniref:hypothetical protein n=1 Tax=Nitratidesulfovibrio sp. 1201_IL3209 TaxID=3084053 RepID=UPI002FD9422C